MANILYACTEVDVLDASNSSQRYMKETGRTCYVRKEKDIHKLRPLGHHVCSIPVVLS